MADAEKAYRIAGERIAEARATGAKALNLSVLKMSDRKGDLLEGDERLSALRALPPEIAEIPGLLALSLNSTQVADLTVLSGLSMLEWLDLTGTRVTDLIPLNGLTALQVLDLTDATGVVDITPLRRLTALAALDLSLTSVEDLAPLSGLTNLADLYLHDTKVEDLAALNPLVSIRKFSFSGPHSNPLKLVLPGAPWSNDDRGLEWLFVSSKMLDDEALQSELKVDSTNAPTILARLREIRDERAPPSPPEPRPEDWSFEAALDGRLRLADERLSGGNADQAALQADLGAQAEALAAALAGSNEFAGLAVDACRYADLLSRPASVIGAKAVWALSCIFRAALAADEAAEREGRLNDQLPPLARAALTNVVTIGGAWLLDHPGVADVEAKARSWRATQGEEREAEAALPVLEAIAAQPDVVEAETAATLSALARLGQWSKAVLDATRGLVVFLLRTAWRGVKLTAGGLILIGSLDAGVQVALRFIATHEATIRAWLAASSPDALRFLDALVRVIGL